MKRSPVMFRPNLLDSIKSRHIINDIIKDNQYSRHKRHIANPERTRPTDFLCTTGLWLSVVVSGRGGFFAHHHPCSSNSIEPQLRRHDKQERKEQKMGWKGPSGHESTGGIEQITKGGNGAPRRKHGHRAVPAKPVPQTPDGATRSRQSCRPKRRAGNSSCRPPAKNSPQAAP